MLSNKVGIIFCIFGILAVIASVTVLVVTFVVYKKDNSSEDETATTAAPDFEVVE